VKAQVRENCEQQYEIFGSWTVQREHILVFPWQHSKLLYCWRLNEGQQYKRNALLSFCSNTGYSYVSPCYVTRTLPILLCSCTDWRQLAKKP
jgi:hypothetical protein